MSLSPAMSLDQAPYPTPASTQPDSGRKDLLAGFSLFDGVPVAQRQAVARHCTRLAVAAGEVLIEQGEESQDIYLIKSGRFDVIFYDEGGEYAVNHLGSGSELGIAAILGRTQRSATVRAALDSTVYRLPYSVIEAELGVPENSPYTLLLRNQLAHAYGLLQRVNVMTVEALKQELEQVRKQAEAGRFLVILISSVTMYAFLLRLFMGSVQGNIDSTWVSAVVLLGCLLFYGPMMKFSGFSPSTYGLTLRNWRAYLLESLRWTAGILLALTLLKAAAIQFWAGWQDQALFSMYGFTRYNTLGHALGLMLVYACLVPVQELVARGAVQSSLHEFLHGRHANLWAILLSTLIFSQIHLHLNPGYALAALISSLFWGALYAKQRSLVGVTISHVLIGIYVAFFLGMPLLEHS